MARGAFNSSTRNLMGIIVGLVSKEASEEILESDPFAIQEPTQEVHDPFLDAVESLGRWPEHLRPLMLEKLIARRYVNSSEHGSDNSGQGCPNPGSG